MFWVLTVALAAKRILTTSSCPPVLLAWCRAVWLSCYYRPLTMYITAYTQLYTQSTHIHIHRVTVWLTLSMILTSALAPNNILTTLQWPFWAAPINAVTPTCTESRAGEHTHSLTDQLSHLSNITWLSTLTSEEHQLPTIMLNSNWSTQTGLAQVSNGPVKRRKYGEVMELVVCKMCVHSYLHSPHWVHQHGPQHRLGAPHISGDHWN